MTKKVTCYKHDFEKFIENAKLINLIFSNARHA